MTQPAPIAPNAAAISAVPDRARKRSIKWPCRQVPNMAVGWPKKSPRIKQAPAFNPGKLAVDESLADVASITRIGDHDLLHQRVGGVAGSLYRGSGAGDDQRVTTGSAGDQHAVF